MLQILVTTKVAKKYLGYFLKVSSVIGLLLLSNPKNTVVCKVLVLTSHIKALYYLLI